MLVNDVQALTILQAEPGCCGMPPTVRLPDTFAAASSSFVRLDQDLIVVGPTGATLRIADYFAWHDAPDLVWGLNNVLGGRLVVSKAHASADGVQASFPQTEIHGHVAELRDDAVIVRATGVHGPLSLGDVVGAGDTLLTDHGAVVLALPDQSTVTIEGGGRLHWLALATANGEVRPFAFQVTAGQFTYLPGLPRSETAVPIHIEMPEATINTTGTAFNVRSSEGRGLDVWLEEGAGITNPLVIANAHGSEVLFDPGTVVSVSALGRPLVRHMLVASELTGDEATAQAHTEPEHGIDGLEVSPGGDLQEFGGDPIVVSGEPEFFDLTPEAAPLAEPFSGVLLQSGSTAEGPKPLTEELLLQQQQPPVSVPGSDGSSGLEGPFLRGWENEPNDTQIWPILGLAQLSARTPDLPLIGARRAIEPREGQWTAMLQPDSAGIGDVDSFLGLNIGAVFRQIPGTQPASLSALKTTMSLTAGSELSFDWFFDAGNETARRDFALFTINGQVFKLADSLGTGVGGATGWRTFVYKVSQTAGYTIGFAVVNDLTVDGPSRLFLDTVRVDRAFDDSYTVIDGTAGGPWRVLAQKPLVADDTLIAHENETALTSALSLLANDVDPDPFDQMGIAGIDRTGTLGRISFASDGTITYLAGSRFDYLTAGESATDTFHYEVDGGNGLRSLGTVHVTIIGGNDAPVTQDDGATISASGVGITIDALANDDDVDSDDDRGSLRIVDATATSGAPVAFSGQPGAGLQYRPEGRFAVLAAGEMGIDQIAYTVEDRHGARTTSNVLIQIVGVNDAPQTVDDVGVCLEDLTTSLNVLENDDDIDSDDDHSTLSIVAAQATSGARVSFSGNPSEGLQYSAETFFDHLAVGEVATDSIVYSIADRHGARASATVTVTVTGTNDAPIAAVDNSDVTEDASLTILNVLANDDDVDSDDDRTSLRLVAARAASGAAVAVDGHPGTDLGYSAAGLFDYLGEGETASDTVIYTIEDRHGARGTGTALVSIIGANDAPVAGDDSLEASEDEAEVSFHLLRNDSDPDISDRSRLRIGAVDGTPLATGGSVTLASGAVVTLAGDGSLSYASSLGFNGLSVGEFATDQFQYTILDPHGAASQATATILIEGINDAPTAMADTAAIGEGGGAVAISVLANDDDVDGDDDSRSLMIVEAHADSGAYVSFSRAPGGALAYDPAGRFEWLGEGEIGTDIITYTVSDRHNAHAIGTAVVTLTGVNDAPVAIDDQLLIDAANVLSLPAGAVIGNDRDPDINDRLRVVAVNGEALSVGRTIALASGALLTLSEDGSLVYNPNGRFDYLLDRERASDAFEYTVEDPHGLRDTGNATVTILGRNDPPLANPDEAITDQDSAIRVSVLLNDADLDAGGNVRVIGIDTAGTRGLVRMNADGTLTYDPAGRFADLQAGEMASDTFRYILDDFVGGRSTASVTVRIAGIRNPQATPQEIIQSFELTPFPSAWWGAEGQAQAAVSYAAASGGTFLPTHGATMVVMASTDTPAAILQQYLSDDVTIGGRPLITLPVDPVGGSSPTTGAATKSSISLSAGDIVGGRLTLAFDWNFISAETAPAQTGANDYAVLTLSDGRIAHVLKLTDARAIDGQGAGWRTSQVDVAGLFSLPAAGELRLTLGFAVLNDQTADNPSHLLIDNVRLNRTISSNHEQIDTGGDGRLVTYRERPEAADDRFGTVESGGMLEDAPIALSARQLLGNDRPSAGVSVDSLSLLSIDASGTAGAITRFGDAITYDPRGAFDWLAAGQTAEDSFAYMVRDGNGGTNSARVYLTVAGLNDAPVATLDTAIADEHGEAISINVLANDDDVDTDDDRASLRVISAVAGSGAVVSFSGAAGAGLIYDGRGIAAVAGLGAGETLTDTITYTIEDRHGARATGSATVTVTGENDAPTAAADQVSTDEDAAVTLSVLANDTDPDLRDRLSIASVNGRLTGFGGQIALASGAFITVNDDGTLRYDPAAAFTRLAEGQTAVDTFSYAVSDGHGGTSQTSVLVRIDGRNDAPVAIADVIATDASTPLTVAATTLLSNDYDPDAGDAFRLASIDAQGALGAVSFDGHSIVYDPNGQFRSLGAGETAEDAFEYRITDAAGAVTDGHITVTVRGLNDAPVAIDDVAATDEDTAVFVPVLANDSDPDTTDTRHIIGLDTSGTRGLVTISADGKSVTYDPRGQFDHLSAGQSQQDAFTYRIADGHGGEDEATVTVTINGRSDTERLVESFESPISPDIRSSAIVTAVGSYLETDGARQGYNPTDGRSMARLEASGTPAQPIGQETTSRLEAFLGIPNQSLPRDPQDATFPANGSAIRLKVNVLAGDELSFDWMFDARDTLPDNDYAIMSIAGAGDARVFKLSDVRSTGSTGASGWRSSIFTAPTTGELTIGLAVINDRSTAPSSENSVLLVDNVRLNRDFGDGYQVVDSQGHGIFETVMLT